MAPEVAKAKLGPVAASARQHESSLRIASCASFEVNAVHASFSWDGPQPGWASSLQR